MSALKTITVSALTTALAVGSTHAGSQGDTVVPLVSAAGAAGLCFHRAYGSDHLKRNPGQTITAMTVLLKPLQKEGANDSSVNLSAKITLRDGAERFGMAACWWEKEANIEGARRVLPSLGADDGTRCMSAIALDSAEEAGELVLDATRSGTHLLLHNGFYQMRVGLEGKRFMVDTPFGKDDRVLRLALKPLEQCSGLEEALAERVKAQAR